MDRAELFAAVDEAPRAPSAGCPIPIENGSTWNASAPLTRPAMNAEEAKAFGAWLLSFQTRPWDWVLACYPWGVRGSPLERRRPEDWQRKLLIELQNQLEKLRASGGSEAGDVVSHVLRFSTAAGVGVGKTSLVSWIIHWFVSVYPNCEAVVTAGTRDQLDGKTWRELIKWQQMAVNGWQMEWTATRYRHADAPNTWFAEARAWSEANPQAMAGTHERYVLFIFDEASTISRIIWETVEGGLVSGLCLFMAFGNPMEGDGAFWDTHNGSAARLWTKFRVDARSVSFANQAEIASWIETYGADSDYCRTHIYGMFPKHAALSLIPQATVEEAVARIIEWREIPRAIPRLMGVDIARQGGDLNSLVRRQGRKVAPDIREWSERDTMKTAEYIARVINEWRPDRVYVDGVGVGAGVVDYLWMRGYQRVVVDVQSGRRPDDEVDKLKYVNMRAVMWLRMLEWMRGADLPRHPKLMEELCQPRAKHEMRTDRMLVESKDAMRARGVASPNVADALSYTFWDSIPPMATAGALVGSGGFAEPEAI